LLHFSMVSEGEIQKMSLINAASGHAGQVITSYFNLQTAYELPISKMEKSS